MNTLAAPSNSTATLHQQGVTPQRIYVDLSGVDDLSASEIARLTRAARENSRKGSEFVLSGVSARLQSVLEGVRMHRLAKLESASAPVRRVAALEFAA